MECDKFMKKIGFDIGSWDGDTLYKFENYDIIYAFEPHPSGFNKLKNKNIKNVKCYNKGISSIPGIKKFKAEQNLIYAGCSSFLDLDEDGEFTKELKKRWNINFNMTEMDIECIRLDEFIKNEKIDKINFIKIDTQGSDYDVLLSLGDEIHKIEKIELEVILKPFYKNQGSREKIISYLNNKNFKVFEETPNHKENEGFENNLIFINEK